MSSIDNLDTSKVTRFEVVDHTPCGKCTDAARILCGACGGTGVKGRTVVMWDENKQLDIQLQDDNRTLKVFISRRSSDATV